MKKGLIRCRAAGADNKGFTLIELMVVVVLLALVFAVAYQFFGFSGNMMSRSETLADRQNTARLIIQGLRKDIGTALDVAIVNAADPDAFSVAANHYAVYAVNNQLVRKDSAGTVETIYTITPIEFLGITFTSTSASVLRISITGKDGLINETDVSTLNTTINTDTTSGFSTSGNLILYQLSD